MDNASRKTGLNILIIFVTLGILGIGSYTLYDYLRVQKINANTVTPEQAQQLIIQNSN